MMKDIEEIRSFRRSGKFMNIFSKFFSKHDFQTELDLPRSSPIIFAANHRSFFDVIIAWAFFSLSGVNCHCLIRADLFSKPLMGSWLRKNGCIATSRDTREEAELQAIEKLKAGYAVAIMPEGRLVPPADRPEGVGQGRPGISRIARATGATIVPVAITGSDLVWPLGKGFPIPRLKRPVIKVRFGAPFDL
ncbi:MAG: lysophospholipid acyltransferase family protein, partial [Actinomycetota bacterium]|nr:lysophospholipid acyltransferase family protein [Actinomycetota bacterium]